MDSISVFLASLVTSGTVIIYAQDGWTRFAVFMAAVSVISLANCIVQRVR